MNWKNDPTRAFHNCRNSKDYFGRIRLKIIHKYSCPPEVVVFFDFWAYQKTANFGPPLLKAEWGSWILKSQCDVIVKYTFKGNDYYEIGNTQDATKHCKYNKFKESAENKQK